MANTIALKGDYVRKEAVASESITPGHVVEPGGSNELRKHANAGEVAKRAFALENDLVGDAIGDDYDSGDTVQYGVFEPGAEVSGWLATGNDVSEGDPLESDGAGGLQAVPDAAATADEERHSTIAFAAEDLNNTSGSQSRIDLEVA